MYGSQVLLYALYVVDLVVVVAGLFDCLCHFVALAHDVDAFRWVVHAYALQVVIFNGCILVDCDVFYAVGAAYPFIKFCLSHPGACKIVEHKSAYFQLFSNVRGIILQIDGWSDVRLVVELHRNALFAIIAVGIISNQYIGAGSILCREIIGVFFS